MLLPNADKALISLEKLMDYCLSLNHPTGKNKAKVFYSILGISHTNAQELRDIILNEIVVNECVEKDEDAFGKRYEVLFRLRKNNREAKICTAWMIRTGEDFPRLTTCYLIK